MEDAHPAIGQLAVGLAVGLAASSEVVVVAPRTIGVGQRAEGPPIEGSSQAAVPRISGQHHPAAT